jgi:ribose/xylose/arabinose/galactoside ABC-type transport system permease subunit
MDEGEDRRFRVLGLGIRLTPRKAVQVALDYAMVFVLVLLLVAATIVYPGFISSTNIANIVSQNSDLGLVAIGMTFVIIGGGFDLSVGAIYALCAVLFAGVSQSYPLPEAALFTVIVGAIAGTINGYLITSLDINPFVATLGTGSAIAGLALVYTGGFPVQPTDPNFSDLGTGRFAGVPIAAVLLLVAFLIAAVVLHRTVYGRALFAVGGNWEAARLSGIRVKVVRASTYSLIGLLTGIAGVLIASRLNVGQAAIGALLPLQAISVVVIGGTSLLGGDGAIWRTAVGLAVLAVLTNLFYSLSIDFYWQRVMQGVIILIAVGVDAYGRRVKSA